MYRNAGKVESTMLADGIYKLATLRCQIPNERLPECLQNEPDVTGHAEYTPGQSIPGIV